MIKKIDDILVKNIASDLKKEQILSFLIQNKIITIQNKVGEHYNVLFIYDEINYCAMVGGGRYDSMALPCAKRHFYIYKSLFREHRRSKDLFRLQAARHLLSLFYINDIREEK